MSKICNPDNCSTIGVLQLKIDGLKEKMDQQEKYAELGRLALTTRASVCGSSDFKKFPNRCENHCFNYPYCDKRAELLAGEK